MFEADGIRSAHNRFLLACALAPKYSRRTLKYTIADGPVERPVATKVSEDQTCFDTNDESSEPIPSATAKSQRLHREMRSGNAQYPPSESISIIQGSLYA